TTAAGTPTPGGGYSGDGGPASAAQFSNVRGLALSGNTLFLADANNSAIRTITFPAQVAVATAPTSTAVTASDPDPAPGPSVTFTADVRADLPSTGVPTGSVTFMNGATSLGTVNLANGTASVSASFSTPGVHTVLAVYSGDANF